MAYTSAGITREKQTMRLVKIGVAAVSVKVGDFAGNEARLRGVIEAAKAEGVHLLVTPELGISGYSLEDKISWPDVTRHSQRCWSDCWGHAPGFPSSSGCRCASARSFNAAAFIHDGRLRGYILKRHLPAYSVFYEGRNWTAWEGGCTEIDGVPAGDLVFRVPYGVVSAEICEDLWSANSPAAGRVRAGAGGNHLQPQRVAVHAHEERRPEATDSDECREPQDGVCVLKPARVRQQPPGL